MKKKIIIGVSIVLVVMAIGYGIHYQKGVIFDKASEYLVFCGDRAGTTMHIDTTYQGTKDIQIKELADYQANFQTDPAYVVNDPLSYDTKLQKHFNTPMIINLLDGSVVEFSKVSYEENGKTKTADIGRHHYEFRKEAGITISNIEESDEKYTVLLDFELDEGTVKNIELTNPDFKANKITYKELSKGKYRITLTFEPMKEGYTLIGSSLKFTLDINGKEVTRYGVGRIRLYGNVVGLDYTVGKDVSYKK